jgi:hypothetical protein
VTPLMESAGPVRAVLDKNRRLATELIQSDERLAADLTDDPAGLLLSWATARGREIVDSLYAHDPEADHEAIAAAMQPVRRIARLVNDLTAARTGLDEAEFVVRLLALLDACRPLGAPPHHQLSKPPCPPAGEPPRL